MEQEQTTARPDDQGVTQPAAPSPFVRWRKGIAVSAIGLGIGVLLAGGALAAPPATPSAGGGTPTTQGPRGADGTPAAGQGGWGAARPGRDEHGALGGRGGGEVTAVSGSTITVRRGGPNASGATSTVTVSGDTTYLRRQRGHAALRRTERHRGRRHHPRRGDRRQRRQRHRAPRRHPDPAGGRRSDRRERRHDHHPGARSDGAGRDPDRHRRRWHAVRDRRPGQQHRVEPRRGHRRRAHPRRRDAEQRRLVHGDPGADRAGPNRPEQRAEQRHPDHRWQGDAGRPRWPRTPGPGAAG